MPDRYVRVVFRNETQETLILTDVSLKEARWLKSEFPPKVIYSEEEVSWACIPTNEQANIEGLIRFSLLKKALSLFIEWEQQATLTNGYGYSIPAGYEIQKSGGSGNKAVVEFRLIESSVFQTETF